MPDYKNSKIYTIRCRDDPTLIYVGSTTQQLSQRWTDHKKNAQNPKIHDYTMKVYECMRNNNFDSFYIELYEDYPCDNKEQLTKREGQIIRELGTLNKQIAGRTLQEYKEDNKDNKNKYMREYHYKHQEKRSEYHKLYYEINTDKIKEHGKQYREKNAEKIKEKKAQTFTCECGCSLTIVAKSRHIKTKKHLDLMEAKNAQQDTEEKNI
jgi:hypothetical protein